MTAGSPSINYGLVLAVYLVILLVVLVLIVLLVVGIMYLMIRRDEKRIARRAFEVKPNTDNKSVPETKENDHG